MSLPYPAIRLTAGFSRVVTCVGLCVQNGDTQTLFGFACDPARTGYKQQADHSISGVLEMVTQTTCFVSATFPICCLQDGEYHPVKAVVDEFNQGMPRNACHASPADVFDFSTTVNLVQHRRTSQHREVDVIIAEHYRYGDAFKQVSLAIGCNFVGCTSQVRSSTSV